MVTWGEKELEMRDGSIILDMVDDEMLKFIQKCFTTEFCLRNVDFDNKIAHFSQFLDGTTSFWIDKPHFPLVRKILAAFDYLNITPIFVARISMFELRMDLRKVMSVEYNNYDLCREIYCDSKHLYISDAKIITFDIHIILSGCNIYAELGCLCRYSNTYQIKLEPKTALFEGTGDKYHDKLITWSAKHEKTCDNFSLILDVCCHKCGYIKKYVVFAVERTICDFDAKCNDDATNNCKLASIFVLKGIL